MLVVLKFSMFSQCFKPVLILHHFMQLNMMLVDQ